MEVASDARLEQVTVYAHGARVERVAMFELDGAALPNRVRITGLPAAVIDDTVRVQIEGPAIATNVRTGVTASEFSVDEEAPELRAARRRVAVAEAEVERIDAALQRAASMALVEDDPSDDAPAPWSAVVQARRAVVAVRVEREQALRDAATVARRTLDEANRALAAASDRERRTGSARPAKLHELRKHVDLEVVANAAGGIAVRLEYLVAAARWAPSYVARLDGERASVEIRAVVAQDTGEDWAGVPLRLSTAEPTRFAQLPELAAQRIGRRQQEPARAGFRAPPIGADALYADYDRALPAAIATRRSLEPSPIAEEPPPPADLIGELAGEVWDDEDSRSKEAFRTRTVAPPPPPQARPPSEFLKRAGAPAAAPAPSTTVPAGYGGGAPLANKVDDGIAARAIPAAPAARLDYGNLVMATPSSPQRGKLISAPSDARARALADEVATAHDKLARLPLPPAHHAAWAHTYDYAYATTGAVDVRADGAWHAVAVSDRATTAKLRHVAVPREQADVFRIVAFANPFAGPLLPGPIDVYDRGRFVVTSEVEYTPPSARVEIGLGVDPAVKIARNTDFREAATGMLRGRLELHHGIAIDVENVSGRTVEVEVRERVPVTRDGDDDVEVVIGRVEPAWERLVADPVGPHARRLRGGYRWRVVVPAGQKKTLRASYEVKLAQKHELVGGNRRES